jgi:hypothetical protein
VEGDTSLEVINAIMMAGHTRTPVTLPLDGEAYVEFLEQMKREHGGKKSGGAGRDVVVNMEASFR